uniref:Uncharacterized protein n=1 Tax=Romanomermis culicivorax TaxID=13658 RepID=A0A915J9D0_ROMCU
MDQNGTENYYANHFHFIPLPDDRKTALWNLSSKALDTLGSECMTSFTLFSKLSQRMSFHLEHQTPTIVGFILCRHGPLLSDDGVVVVELQTAGICSGVESSRSDDGEPSIICD